MRRAGALFWIIPFCSVVLVLASLGFAESTAYIDSIQEELRQKAPSDASVQESYIQKKQEEFSKTQSETGVHSRTDSVESGSYIEHLKTAPGFQSEKPSDSYIETERLKLDPHHDSSSLVDAVRSGTQAQLNVPKKPNLHSLFGFKYGISPLRNLSGGLADFDSIYGAKYAPEFSFYYEYQPFHSEIFGNFGIVGMLGVGYYRGTGQLNAVLDKPAGVGGVFSTTSSTNFTFLSLPVTVALDYRFNLLRYIRPYIMVGPTGVVFFETRSDALPGNRGNSKSLLTSVGASILLDWISRGSNWDLYQMHGFQHFYLVVDYTRITPLAGDIRYGSSGLSLGMAMEY